MHITTQLSICQGGNFGGNLCKIVSKRHKVFLAKAAYWLDTMNTKCVSHFICCYKK